MAPLLDPAWSITAATSQPELKIVEEPIASKAVASNITTEAPVRREKRKRKRSEESSTTSTVQSSARSSKDLGPRKTEDVKPQDARKSHSRRTNRSQDTKPGAGQFMQR
ncbi:hypothetical protein E4U21_005675 [Claviceps maximensis]|nr:hypothetical protein E4U21_005675 [Claviceps maximensis]